jgi:MtN3 and saliva related transmembrane protein
LRLRERSSPASAGRAWPPIERDSITKEDSMVSTALGVTAASWALVMALAPILQIREMVRRGSSEGVSIGYFAVLLVGFSLWVAYGLANGDLPLIVPNCVAFLVMGCTIAVALDKRRHDPRRIVRASERQG